MILNYQQIIDTCKSNDIVIDPFDVKQVQGATYDLRVGEQGATTSTKKLINIRENGYLTLDPGDFGIITTLEIIKLSPSYVGRFGMRSKYARKGLIATTGPQIDPGFRGRLIIGITNLTPKPISIPYKDHFLSVEFHKLEEPSSKPYDSPYQDTYELRPEEIEHITETEGMALSEMLTTLRTLSKDVGSLSSSIKMMQWIIPIIVAFGIAVI